MAIRLFRHNPGLVMLPSLAIDVVSGYSHTLLRFAPYLIGMGVVFALLSWVSPCNAGKPWWDKRGLVTDLCYWFVVPVFSRYGRIGFTVLATVYLFGINTEKGILAYYDHGHGPISELPYWWQVGLYLVGTEFVLYWIHRGFHSSRLWRFHAVHHSTEDLEWVSASRFHPVNLLMGTVLVDVVVLLSGFSPDVFVVMAPFSLVTSGWVHANLNWTLGPFKYVLAGPVFHRWHHDKATLGKNFASTFSLFDWMFGTFYMPEGKLPANYGLIEDTMPKSFGAQVLYPLVS
jgi:sterol desaturase/sphingolipid hydroxylase (fatty acid hydroxylase superfamily)